MKSATHCQLLLPSMIQALAQTASCPPSLATLLRFATRRPGLDGDDHAWRCHFFGVARQQDDPVAPFASLALGLDPAACYWLCATPVNLQLQRDSFVLAEGQMRGLSLMQAEQLVASLNAHFGDDGLHFFAPDAHHWYLRLPQPPAIATQPLLAVIGQSVQRLLPQGDQGLQWHQRINEIQMLLHEHSVNLDLERQGELPVNSLWLWGGGVLAPGPKQAGLTVWAQDAVTRGLALAHGSQLMDCSAWPQGGLASGEHLVVLNGLEAAALQLDAPAWADALAGMETHWFAPLLAAVRDGRVDRLDLHLAGAHKVSSYRVSRMDLCKFWRRAQPLGAYLV